MYVPLHSHSSLVHVEQLNYCMLLYLYAPTLQLGLIVEIIYVYMYSKRIGYICIKLCISTHAQEIYTTICIITLGSMLKFHWLSIHYVQSNAWQSGCTSPCMMQRVYSGD